MIDADGNSLTWDENGNLLTDVDANFVYNWDNKLKDANCLGDTITVKYEPFGLHFVTEVNETVVNPLQFTGQWLDSEISQYYLRERQYDLSIGRFTSPDPIKGGLKKQGTLHVYLYCLNDSVYKTDHEGKFAGIITGAYTRERNFVANMGALAFAQRIANQAQLYYYRIGFEVQKFARGGEWTRKLRQNLIEVTGKIRNSAVHHVLPRAFEGWFTSRGIENIHDPIFGMWIDTQWHLSMSHAYNKAWEAFIIDYPQASVEQILNFAKEISDSIMQCPTFFEYRI